MPLLRLGRATAPVNRGCGWAYVPMTATYLVIVADKVVFRTKTLGEAWAFQQGRGEPCQIARQIRMDESESPFSVVRPPHHHLRHMQ